MVQFWDTFGLFEELLLQFDSALPEARDLASQHSGEPLAVRIARVGFSYHCRLLTWSQPMAVFVEELLNGDISLGSLKWYEDSAEAIQVFCCFAVGAMLGKLNSEEIDDAGYLLGYAHLAAFNSEHDVEISQKYKLALSRK